MGNIKLLIIEDDDSAIVNYEKSIERINRITMEFKYYIAKNLDEANQFIEYNKLDSAIVDLNLSGEENDLSNNDGNIVIDELIKSFRIPILVVSGEPHKLAEKYHDNNLVSLIARGDKTTQELLDIIKTNYHSPTLKYFSRNGFLEQKINKFYWEYLQESLTSWNNVAIEHETDIEKILSRHTVACLNEQLYVNGNIGSFDKYHPGEMYIIPPIKQHYHTGDIIKKEEELFIILNPACDIVNKTNLDFYLLCKIITFDSLPKLQEKIKKEANPSDLFYDKLNKGGKNCYNDCKTNKKDRFHFLVKFDKFDERLIDFQQVLNVTEEEIKNYTREASISSQFLKDIVARFSLYYARQGQPNLLN